MGVMTTIKQIDFKGEFLWMQWHKLFADKILKIINFSWWIDTYLILNCRAHGLHCYATCN